MNFTQEMYDDGELPKVGMKAMYEGKEVTVIGFKTNGAIVFEKRDGFTEAMCNPTGNYKIKPNDTRTDTEKAVDFMESNYGYNSEYGEAFISDIKAGKITGVKWVGND